MRNRRYRASATSPGKPRRLARAAGLHDTSIFSYTERAQDCCRGLPLPAPPSELLTRPIAQAIGNTSLLVRGNSQQPYSPFDRHNLPCIVLPPRWRECRCYGPAPTGEALRPAQVSGAALDKWRRTACRFGRSKRRNERGLASEGHGQAICRRWTRAAHLHHQPMHACLGQPPLEQPLACTCVVFGLCGVDRHSVGPVQYIVHARVTRC